MSTDPNQYFRKGLVFSRKTEITISLLKNLYNFSRIEIKASQNIPLLDNLSLEKEGNTNNYFFYPSTEKGQFITAVLQVLYFELQGVLNSNLKATIDELAASIQTFSAYASLPLNNREHVETIIQFAKNEPSNETITALAFTYAVLKYPHKENINCYLNFAQTVSGSSSKNLYILGGVMLALGVFLTIVGIVILTIFSSGLAVMPLLAATLAFLGSGTAFVLNTPEGLSRKLNTLGTLLQKQGFFSQKRSYKEAQRSPQKIS